MKAWLKEDLEQMDLHNVAFVFQAAVLIGVALAAKVYC
jgi:hypothetical protein